MIDNNILGQRVRSCREILQLTQAQLAGSTGVTPQAISHIETGLRLPSHQMLISLSGALRVSTDFLCGLSDDRPAVISNITINQGGK